MHWASKTALLRSVATVAAAGVQAVSDAASTNSCWERSSYLHDLAVPLWIRLACFKALYEAVTHRTVSAAVVSGQARALHMSIRSHSLMPLTRS